jgi:hypothetical protein
VPTHHSPLRGQNGTQVVRLKLLLRKLVQRAFLLRLAYFQSLAECADLQLALICDLQDIAKLLGVGGG